MFCVKSEEVCDKSCARNRVFRVDYEFPNYNYVITRGKNRENKGSISEFIQSIRDITSEFDKANRNSFFNHSSSAPRPSTVLLLTKVTNSISKTNGVLPHFGKADCHCKKRGQIDASTKGWDCTSRIQNRGSMVQKGIGSTYQSAGTYSYQVCRLDICQNVENVRYTYPGRRHDSFKLFAENARGKESIQN